MSNNPGEYNKKIIIYESILSKDEDGFQISEKKVVLKAHASVKTTKGFTLIKNNSDFEKAYTNFTIRYPKTVTITKDMLIEYKGKIYSIEYLNNVNEENIELEIQAKVVIK